ncbi:putative mitochondrial chaperone BCS1 [Patellaria atrata CBS 101060]|uniref:Mitochondrial chaperone BCS1 n=1 Tax=Patellaria atrata CBS 101060 TaxID=1346257 RepID=A0A9P4SIY1_9PEZI|nr:putative mitochondrial chaperone BCS1 [Patellaria atrata CBS 101060]
MYTFPSLNSTSMTTKLWIWSRSSRIICSLSLDAPPGSLFEQLTGNPFFTAGFGLAAIAAAARFGQKALKYGVEGLRRRMLVDITITHKNEHYQPLLHWMSAYHKAQSTGLDPVSNSIVNHESRGLISSLISKFTPRLHHFQLESEKVNRPDGSPITHFSLVPGPGRHLLRYGSAFMLVDRQREKSFDLTSGTPFETVTLTTLYSHRHIIEEIVLDAHKLLSQKHEGKTIIYTSQGVNWHSFGQPKRKRPFDSVVLEKGLKEQILENVRDFLETRTWYLDRGIPYRRGYLLFGPPGTGKTSFIQALAGELDLNIAILNVNERGLTDDRLNVLLSTLPERTIALLEDADAAWINRKKADEHGYSGATVTFSGLLNALDGAVSAEGGRLVFMTTNHIDRLDEALIRPGRVDMQIYIGNATEWQIEQLWDRFYAEFDADGSGRKRFVERARQLQLIDNVSTAALQGLFLHNKGDIEGAISMAEGLVLTRQSRL